MTLNSQELRQLVVDAADDLKAQNISVLDVRKLTDMTDYMVVASGRSKRQVVAIAEKIVESSKASGTRPLGVEGMTEGEWVLVDLCDVVAHIMLPDTREFYQLEKLWGDDVGSVTVQP